jgi:DNA anti-recombination protein RmuC
MTNEELLQDLKQFIMATVSQSVSQAEERTNAHIDRVKTDLEERISDLDTKVDLIHDAIADTFTRTTESTDTILQNHEQRLHRLERRVA